jgi:hypothetical protein
MGTTITALGQDTSSARRRTQQALQIIDNASNVVIVPISNATASINKGKVGGFVHGILSWLGFPNEDLTALHAWQQGYEEARTGIQTEDTGKVAEFFKKFYTGWGREDLARGAAQHYNKPIDKVTESELMQFAKLPASGFNDYERSVVKGMDANRYSGFEQIIAFGFAPAIAGVINNFATATGGNPVLKFGASMLDSSASFMMARQAMNTTSLNPTLKLLALLSHTVAPLVNAFGDALGYDNKTETTNWFGKAAGFLNNILMLGNFSVAASFAMRHNRMLKLMRMQEQNKVPGQNYNSHEWKFDKGYQAVGKWVNLIPAIGSAILMPALILTQNIMQSRYEKKLKGVMKQIEEYIEAKREEIMTKLSQHYKALVAQGKSEAEIQKIMSSEMERGKEELTRISQEAEQAYQQISEKVMGPWPTILKYLNAGLTTTYIAMTGYQFFGVASQAAKLGLRRIDTETVAGKKVPWHRYITSYFSGATDLNNRENGSVIPIANMLGGQTPAWMNKANVAMAIIQPLIGVSCMGGQLLSAVNMTPLAQIPIFSSLTQASEKLKQVPGLGLATNLMMLAG